MELITVNDISYGPVIRAFFRESAIVSGFEDQEELASLETAVFEGFKNSVEHGYPSGERGPISIKIEKTALGLKVIIKDQGIPFDAQSAFICNVDGVKINHIRGLCLLRSLVDDAQLKSLGPDGKELIIEKYANASKIVEYFSENTLKAYPLDKVSGQGDSNPSGEFTIGRLKPEEAVEVSRCVYKSYGYSYALDHVYYPDRIIGLNRDGHMISAVCRTPENEVAGHCALVFHNRKSKIAELAQAFVKPEYRAKGCFSKMNQYLIDQAKDMDLLGLYGQAVTNHTYSQRMGLALGMKDCAIKLGYVPENASFKGITDRLPQRDTLLVQFLFLKEDKRHKIFAPARHEQMIMDLLKSSGSKGLSEKPAKEPVYEPVSGDTISVQIMKTLKASVITLRQYTKTSIEDVRTALMDLCAQDIEIIHLYLNLEDPMTYFKTEEFEAIGFFFSGVLPGHMGSDSLILQYLNNLEIDYDLIKIRSEKGKQLLNYIKSCDSNE